MRRDHGHPLLAAAGFGALAGMRTFSAPALLAHRLTHGPARPNAAVAPGAARALEILAVGELIADKLPWMPARVRALPLAGRALSGALTGAAAGTLSSAAREEGPAAGRAPADGGGVSHRDPVDAEDPDAGHPAEPHARTRIVAAAVVGGASAVATAFALYHLRRLAGRRLRLPNAAAGVAEDGLALLVGRTAVRMLPPAR